MYHYKSEATQFLDIPQQMAVFKALCFQLLWDVELDPQEQKEFEAAKVAKKPYTYYQD